MADQASREDLAGRGDLASYRDDASGSKVLTGSGRRDEIALRIVAAATIGVGLAVLALRWKMPLIGGHSFRQTQTAITTYWLIRGAPWLAYPTPVMGAPWSIPYEFPIFQLIVAGVVKLSGMPLDAAGRMVSYMFVVLTIIPAGVLARAYGMGKREALVFAILMLASPIYLYWGTAFLMETMVVFFCCAFLAETKRSAGTMHWKDVGASVICGTLGALGKITTFAPFYILAGIILSHHLVIRLRRHQPVWRLMLSGGAMMIPPPLVFMVWDRFADGEKLKNPIGRLMISTAPMMRQWNFGTWGQLFSVESAAAVLRASLDTLGIAAPAIVVVLGFAGAHYRIFERRTGVMVAAAMGGFLLPFAMFTNLHIVHNYYDTANAVFLIGAAAIVIGRWFSARHYRIAWGFLLLTIASQLVWFRIHFVKEMIYPRDRPLMAIARTVKAHTSADGVVVIYGQEWSPEVPYYAQRRAVMEPSFVPHAEVIARMGRLLSPQGGYPVEAIVRCPSAMDREPEFVRAFAGFDARFPKERIGECEVYFTAGEGR